MDQAIIKILISIILVVLLAEISKRVNPTLGGTLSGLPLGIGLSAYFIIYSEGVPFFIKSIPWGIAGLSSSILFSCFYLLGGKLLQKYNNIISILLSIICGLAAFLFSGYWLQRIDLSLPLAVVIFVTVFILNIVFVKKIKTEVIGREKKKKPTSIISLLIRGVVVGLIIIIITGTASLVGIKWAGIFNSFPSTLFSLLLVLHFEEGNNLYPSVIYGFSYSVSALMVFYILCFYILPMLGLNLGYAVIYAGSLLYLLAFNKISKVLSRKC